MSDQDKAPASEEQQAEAPASEPSAPATERGGEATAAEKMKEKWRRTSTEKEPVRSLDQEELHSTGFRANEFDDEIEQELAEAMGEFSPDELMGDPGKKPSQEEEEEGAAPGKKKGTIFRIHGKDVFVDVPGGRTQGLLQTDQFPPEKPPQVGDEVEVSIEGAQDGLLILSLKGGAVQDADWSTIEEEMIVEARVTETNKGGLTVDVNGIRGFMPISQIDIYRVEDTDQYVNQKLRCIVTEAKKEERNLVVSRRALLEKEREEQREHLWGDLKEGQVRHGVVRSIKDFGAFVDLGGVDGLLHVSEMSWSRVQKASDVVHEGQTLQVQILRIDHEKRKISLGLKQMTTSPWESVTENYPLGSTATGKVTKLMDFGAFVELEPGIEGLIHISELAPQRVHRVGDIVEVGQEVSVKVLDVDTNKQRIGLSLKALQESEEPEKADEEQPQEEEYVPKPRKSTKPLRGGVGRIEITWDPNEDED